MSDSFSLETRDASADIISAMQHEKRACRVKCTLCTQGQEATKTNETTVTESKGKNGLRTAWIYPRPSGSTAPSRRKNPLNSPWCRWRRCASTVRRLMCSFELICSLPGFAVLNQSRSRFHNSFPDPFLAPRPDPTNQRPRRVIPSESARLLCCVNPSRSSGHEFVQRCVLLNSGCLFVPK